MSDRKSQEGTGDLKPFSFAGLCERARQVAALQEELEKQKQEKKGKGLEFMAYRIEIAQVHLDLSIRKKITPAEHNLLRLLELCTIGAQNGRSYICSKIDFQIEDLSSALGYKDIEHGKIWRLLKSLEKKKFIIRQKTRSKGTEILGLNPEVFGQILIEKHQAVDNKRHLRIAVDNTKGRVDNSERKSTERTG